MVLACLQTGPRYSHLLHLFPFPRPTRDSVCRLWVGRGKPAHCIVQVGGVVCCGIKGRGCGEALSHVSDPSVLPP